MPNLPVTSPRSRLWRAYEVLLRRAAAVLAEHPGAPDAPNFQINQSEAAVTTDSPVPDTTEDKPQ